MAKGLGSIKQLFRSGPQAAPPLVRRERSADTLQDPTRTEQAPHHVMDLETYLADGATSWQPALPVIAEQPDLEDAAIRDAAREQARDERLDDEPQMPPLERVISRVEHLFEDIRHRQADADVLFAQINDGQIAVSDDVEIVAEAQAELRERYPDATATELMERMRSGRAGRAVRRARQRIDNFSELYQALENAIATDHAAVNDAMRDLRRYTGESLEAALQQTAGPDAALLAERTQAAYEPQLAEIQDWLRDWDPANTSQ